MDQPDQQHIGTADVDPVQAEKTAYQAEVLKTMRRMAAQEEARDALRNMQFSEEWREPLTHPTLVEGLAVPRPPLQYGIEGLVIKGGNVLITAGFKVGKTDLMLNIMKCYTDDVPFLDKYDVLPLDPGKKVAFWDFELDEDYAWDLIRTIGFARPERGVLQTWRGYALPLTSPEVRDWAVEWLIRNQVQVLIIDPFGAVYQGEENSNTEVRTWLRALTEIKERASLREVYMTIHTGKTVADEGAESARGATVTQDWGDSLWYYNRARDADLTDPRRFMSAIGRGAVAEAEFEVEWRQADHHLGITGGGSRAKSREARVRDAIIAYLTTNPDASGRSIKEAVKANPTSVANMLRKMLSDGEVTVRDGVGKAQLWTLDPSTTAANAMLAAGIAWASTKRPSI